MSERKAFIRKIAYAVAIAVLLIPLYWLSSPSTRQSPQGGRLAQFREAHGLSQADLGEIDPTSETVKLATLGLRGVAVNLLWGKANEYKKKEDWTNLMAVLDQLTKLQPNFIKFWEYQGWNVSYNVSVQFDDYRDRYYYVRRGIEFLQEGIRYNESNQLVPRLLWDVGWFVGQKIGKADEHKQYRELFRKDDDYHGEDRPLVERDNWLQAEEWYDRAIRGVLQEMKSIGRMSKVVFFQSPASARINYSEAIESEGTFGTWAEQAWRRAHERFLEFGDHQIEHSTGVILRLNDYELLNEEAAKLTAQLDAMVPGLKDEMHAERMAKLSSVEKTALDTPDHEKTAEQYRLAADAMDMLEILPRELAERVAAALPEQAQAARELALKIEQVEMKARFTQNYRHTANYEYWKTRTEYEQTQDALLARQNLYEAKQAYDNADLIQARELYEAGFAHWRQVTDRYPSILESAIVGEELLEQILEYRDNVLEQLGGSLSDDFPLWDVIEQYDHSGEFRQELAARGAAAGTPASEAGEDEVIGPSSEQQPSADEQPPIEEQPPSEE